MLFEGWDGMTVLLDSGALGWKLKLIAIFLSTLMHVDFDGM